MRVIKSLKTKNLNKISKQKPLNKTIKPQIKTTKNKKNEKSNRKIKH